MMKGSWSVPIGIVAAVWGLFMTVVLCLPQSSSTAVSSINYSPIALGGVLLYAGMYWHLSAKFWFKGMGIKSSASSAALFDGGDCSNGSIETSTNANYVNTGIAEEDEDIANAASECGGVEHTVVDFRNISRSSPCSKILHTTSHTTSNTNSVDLGRRTGTASAAAIRGHDIAPPLLAPLQSPIREPTVLSLRVPTSRQQGCCEIQMLLLLLINFVNNMMKVTTMMRMMMT